MVTELAAVTAMTWVDYDKDEDKNGEVMIIVHVMGDSRSAPAGQGQTLQSVQIQSVLLIHFYSWLDVQFFECVQTLSLFLTSEQDIC